MGAPPPAAAASSGVSSKRRKWTDEVLSSVARSRSSSAKAHTGGEPPDPGPDPILDADQAAEGNPAFVLVVELDHERRLPVGAVRNERVVGIELGFDLRRLEYPFGAEDFLHLVLHGQAILEVQGRVGVRSGAGVRACDE